ncbi:hypothetical protein VP01_15472g1, partial [Puccinia sorghi]
PVEEQMMVTLKRLGCFGNGASVWMLDRFFQISAGTMELYTNHCIVSTLDAKCHCLSRFNQLSAPIKSSSNFSHLISSALLSPCPHDTTVVIPHHLDF